MEERVERLYAQLEHRGLTFRPHVWLSTEWFSPADVPGIAIPFYLAHPRLVRLERRQMLEVEGGSRKSFMQILRHEAGHAIDTAYRLRHRKRFREHFGRISIPYPDTYQPRPFSRRFVQHLDGWYAQSHPIEDFAETFAVWLTPGSNWRQRYRGWPAMKKLVYVDELMQSLRSERPKVRSRARPEQISGLRTQLRDHYAELQERYDSGLPDAFDGHLRRIFSDDPRYRGRPMASSFLSKVRPEVRRTVSRWTGEYQYAVDQVLLDLIRRSREQRLRLTLSERRARAEAPVMVAVLTMSYLHTGRPRLAL